MAEDPFYVLPSTNIRTLGPPGELDYFALQSTELFRKVTPLEAWRLLMTRPMPLLKVAFRIRDVISRCFGVKPIGGFSGKQAGEVKQGDKLDFFLVEQISNDCMTLTARDRHLDVATCVSIEENTLSITSSVKTRNRFGRLYMLPVGPAHRLIVRSMLKRLKRDMEVAA